MPQHDPYTMQVQDLPIFIAGDVNAERQILHEAADEGRIAGSNAVASAVTGYRRRTPLAITFTDPNIAHVGLPFAELDQQQVAIGEIRFGPVGRALLMGKNKGVLRVYGHRQHGRLLGASMIAPKGEHLAHLLAWAIQQDQSVFDLLKMPFYHPAIEEGLQAALRDLKKQVVEQSKDVLELAPLDA
jgi:dihydrolipoamide dehydrogenase